MLQAAAFKLWFLRRGHPLSTYNTYSSYLRQIDEAIGGLDEKIAADGVDRVLAWAKTASSGPFENYPTQCRSVLNKYVEFSMDAESPLEGNEISNDGASDPVTFRVEREMQAAVRRQLSNLEQGLKEADGGVETSVLTGRIDIIAEDQKNDLVVIELKAGLCPAGAVEQVLGYAEALSQERGRNVRAYLIASEFPDRIRAAAKRARDLELRTYEFSLKFGVPR